MSSTFSASSNIGLNPDYVPSLSGGGGGAVDSVFGRTGVVIAVAGDYSASEITNDSAVTGAFVTDALNTLDTTKASLNSAVTFGSATPNIQFEVFSNGTVEVRSGVFSVGRSGAAGLVEIFQNNGTRLDIYGGTNVSAIDYNMIIDTQGATNTNGTILVNQGSNTFKFRDISDYTVSKTLTSGNIIVGNGSNVATAVAMSGDATISNTGAVTLKNTGTAGTYGSTFQVPVLTTDAQGRVTSVTNTAITGFVPQALLTANIIVGNGANIAAGVPMTGDIGIALTGLTTIQNNAVTTAKITDANVTYAKIQNVSTNNRILGRATAGAGVLEELTLGTNLSITGTTLNAASAGDVYLAITMSADTTYNKASLGGANYLEIQSNNTTDRKFTVGSGFVANDKLTFAFQNNGATALGKITLDIGTRTITGNKGNVITAIYDGTNWTLSTYASTYKTSLGLPSDYSAFAIGFGANAQNQGNAIGQLSTSFGNGLAIGYNAIAGSSVNLNGSIGLGTSVNNTGDRSIVIGTSSSTNSNDNVVIGNTNNQTGSIRMVSIGIAASSSSASDGVIIGANAGGGSAKGVTIGANSVGTGSDTIRLGADINTGASTGVVAIGRSITSVNTDGIAIGRQASVGLNSVVAGAVSSSGNTAVVIGSGSSSGGSNVVSIGQGNNISANTGVVAIGQGITTTNTDAVIIGRAASGGGTANVTVGGGATGTGANCVRIGNGVATGTNTGVIAIGQGAIVSGATGTDVILIGRNARTGSGGNQSDTIVIGRDSTTGSQADVLSTTDNNIIIGTNSIIQGSTSGIKTINRNILLGNSITMEITTSGSEAYQNNIIIGNFINVGKQSGNNGAVVISNNTNVGNGTASSVVIGSEAKGGAGSGSGQNVIIGHQANGSTDGQFSVCIGRLSSLGNSGGGLQAYNTVIGYQARNDFEKSWVMSKGAYAYPRHYGAESRRIDTNTSNSDATSPSRHAENDAWIGTTTDATPTILTLFGVAAERLTLQDNEMIHYEVMVSAKRNGTTDTYLQKIAGGIVRGGGVGTTVLIGTNNVRYTNTAGTGSTLTYTITADSLNGAAIITVTGNAAETWQWTAYICNYVRTRTA